MIYQTPSIWKKITAMTDCENKNILILLKYEQEKIGRYTKAHVMSHYQLTYYQCIRIFS